MQYRYIKTVSELEPFLPMLQAEKVLAVDTETTGLDPHQNRLRLLQIAVKNQPVFVIDCDFFLPAGKEILNQLFGTNAVKVFQNAKFDLAFLYAAGICIALPLFDTMLAAGVLHSSLGLGRVNLAELSAFFLKETLSKEEQVSDFSGVLRPEQLLYAAKDAEVLLRLREAMIPYIKQYALVEVAELEFSAVQAIFVMEYSGIALNAIKWDALLRVQEARREAALAIIYTYIPKPPIQPTLFGEEISYGENLDSPKQLIGILEKQGIVVENVSRHTLLSFAENPLVAALLEYRSANKLLNSFLYPMPKLRNKKTGRLHPRYMQIGAWSGRMSCSNPNIQQIPREKAFRECFMAPPGRVFIVADYSQIELRVMAEMIGEKRMIRAYQAGRDLHQLTAMLTLEKPAEQITYEERQAAKAINFGLIYAMQAVGLQGYAKDTYGVEMSLAEAERFRERFFREYKDIAAWHARLQRNPPKEVRTLAGRRCVFTERAGLSAFTNTPVQGSAADIMKKAMALLMTRINWEEAYPVAVVHDEILLEVPMEKEKEYTRLLQEVMIEAGEYYLKEVPIVVEAQAGKTWASKN